tara:strand:+ start:193 stop:555 length:363 start_codon:yes stop_codon:yes gene_type:complete
MNIEGEIKLILEAQSFGTSGYRVRKMVVVTDDQYPQMIEVQFVQDKCELLDSYAVGEKVKIDINIRGREWINPDGEAKYFNSIVGWRIERTQDNQGAPNKVKSTKENFVTQDEEPDDLPF